MGFAAVLGTRPRARILIEASTDSEWVARCLEALGCGIGWGGPVSESERFCQGDGSHEEGQRHRGALKLPTLAQRRFRRLDHLVVIHSPFDVVHLDFLALKEVLAEFLYIFRRKVPTRIDIN
jgi:hypothetical protein